MRDVRQFTILNTLWANDNLSSLSSWRSDTKGRYRAIHNPKQDSGGYLMLFMRVRDYADSTPPMSDVGNVLYFLDNTTVGVL